MPKPSEGENFPLTFAEEIRASEKLFIDSAVKLFRERMMMEYPRLRGYAAESGADRVGLDVRLNFSFAPLMRNVEIECVTVPRFRPAPGSARRSVPLPKAPAHAD